MKTAHKIIKKIFAVLVAFTILAIFSITSTAYISSAYQGYYYCTDTSTNYLLFFPDAYSSVFRGSLSGNPSVSSGVYAASDMRGSETTITISLSTDNMEVWYDSYAKLEGNSFVPKSGHLILVGTVLNTSKIRIRGIGGNYYYEK